MVGWMVVVVWTSYEKFLHTLPLVGWLGKSDLGQLPPPSDPAHQQHILPNYRGFASLRTIKLSPPTISLWRLNSDSMTNCRDWGETTGWCWFGQIHHWWLLPSLFNWLLLYHSFESLGFLTEEVWRIVNIFGKIMVFIALGHRGIFRVESKVFSWGCYEASWVSTTFCLCLDVCNQFRLWLLFYYKVGWLDIDSLIVDLSVGW